MKVGRKKGVGVKRRHHHHAMVLGNNIEEGIRKPQSGTRRGGGATESQSSSRIRRCGRGGAIKLEDKVNNSHHRIFSVEIPEDIILNILDRLPLRSLLGSMCVSKSWRSLILHHFTSEQPRRTIFCMLGSRVRPVADFNRLPKLLSCSIDTAQSHGNGNGNGIGILTTHASTPLPDCAVVRFCNGLFCYPHNTDTLAVWDSLSTTKPIQFLPHTHFSQYLSTCKFDFGFDPLSNTYKVIVWSKYPQCEIYTLPTHNSQWRPLTDTTHGGITGICANNIRIHNMLYWYCVADYIVSFDFSHEIFGTVPFPDGVKHLTSLNQVVALFELDDCLCLLDYHHQASRAMDLWTLKDDNAWVMMATVVPTAPPSATLVYPPFSTRTGEFLLRKCLDYATGTLTLYLYNFFTRQHNTIQVEGLHSKEFRFIF